MKLDDFVKQYTLHDAGIVSIDYIPEQEQLVIGVEVTNHEGHIPSFVSTHLDPIPARLVFTGVFGISSDADLRNCSGDEISGARYLPSLHPTKGILELALLTGEFDIEEVKSIQIEAEEIDWEVAL